MKPQDRTRCVLRSGLKSGEKLVLVAVCDYCNTHGESFPSVTTLAADTTLNRATVIKHLSNLEGRGLVKTKRAGRSTLYTFDPESLPTRRESRPVAKDDQSQNTTTVVAKHDHHPSQNTTTPVAKCDPKRIPKRPSEATSEAGATSAPSAALPEGSSNVETLRTKADPDSPKVVWPTVLEGLGFPFAAAPGVKHCKAMQSVRLKLGADVLRAAITAYCEVVMAGTHPWQRDQVPSPGVFCKELPKWVAAGQTPAADTATRARALELVDSIKGRIQAHGGSWKAATADLDGDDLELFARVVCVAGGADAAWQAWPRLGGMRDWDFGRAIDKARDSAGRM